jgi:CarD family transcriptional regulator
LKKINDYIVYRKGVCKIVDIKDDIYTLVPLTDADIKMQVPASSNVLRDLITKEEIDELLVKIPAIEAININDKMIETEYKALMNLGTHEDLIKIIKTTYLRNKNREMHNKRASDKDSEYFRRAEKYLYEELSVVLNLTIEETKEYVKNSVDRLM